MLLHVLFLDFYRWMDSQEFHEQCSQDDQGAAYHVVPLNRFSQIEGSEENAADDVESGEQRNRRNRNALDGFVEAEEVQETRDEAESEQCRNQDQRKRLQFLKQRMLNEWREE